MTLTTQPVYEYDCRAIVDGDYDGDGFVPGYCGQPAIAISLPYDEGRCGSHLPGGADYRYVDPADGFLPTVIPMAA